jgi:hypothetical protein
MYNYGALLKKAIYLIYFFVLKGLCHRNEMGYLAILMDRAQLDEPLIAFKTICCFLVF